jgi:light-regulated signal transduction histidine kinase (bacteriophytochrome)
MAEARYEALERELAEVRAERDSCRRLYEDASVRLQEMAELALRVEELRRAQARSRLLAEQMAHSNRELQEFAYIASHDLQEPLRKVMAFGDRLKSKFSGVLGEQGNDYLERMQSATRRMQTFIDDLLTYSRVTSKGQPFVETDLAQVVREVISDLEVRIEQTGATVEVSQLPVIDADPRQLRQLLQNLIGNALKFHRKGTPPQVTLSGRLTDQDGEAVFELQVSDNGIGFDERYARRIFDVFQRLHGRTEYEGTGIGLSVCKKVVERHGGSIQASSVPNQGSTFTVVVPVRQTLRVAERD